MDRPLTSSDPFFADGDRRRYLAMPRPDHYDPAVSRWACGCTWCGNWRSVRVLPGRLCRPATRDPSVVAPGFSTTPAWPVGEFASVRYVNDDIEIRLEEHGIDRLLVVGHVDRDDGPSGGLLDCVIVLARQGRVDRLLVVQRSRLEVISS